MVIYIEDIMKQKVVLAVMFVFVLSSDQISKYIVASTCPLYEAREIIGTVFMIRYVRNPGAVFGLFRTHPEAVFVLKAVIVPLFLLFIAWLLLLNGLRRYPSLNTVAVKFSLVLIAGSAIGNYIDRMLTGAVIDFIDIGIGTVRWHTFNLADAYLVVAEIVLIYCVIRAETKKEVKTL